MIHYELFFFYVAGFRPKDVIRLFGYSRGTAYRFYNIYHRAIREAQWKIEHGAGNTQRKHSQHRNSVSPRREKKLKHLDD